MQFQSDILGVPVIRPAITETTALGAAYLAGLAVGFWKKDIDASAAAQDRHFNPRMPASQARLLRNCWNEAVARSKNWESSSSESGK
jgi:glycerol kinase